MARIAAFSILVCAAFAWVPPFLDRAGMAALGFAFLAFAFPPPRKRTFRFPSQVAPPVALAEPHRIEPLMRELHDDLAAELEDREPAVT